MSFPKLTRKGLYYLWADDPGGDPVVVSDIWDLEPEEEDFYRGLPWDSLASIARHHAEESRELEGMVGTYGRYIANDPPASDRFELRAAIGIQEAKVSMLEIGLNGT